MAIAGFLTLYRGESHRYGTLRIHDVLQRLEHDLANHCFATNLFVAALIKMHRHFGKEDEQDLAWATLARVLRYRPLLDKKNSSTEIVSDMMNILPEKKKKKKQKGQQEQEHEQEQEQEQEDDDTNEVLGNLVAARALFCNDAFVERLDLLAHDTIRDVPQKHPRKIVLVVPKKKPRARQQPIPEDTDPYSVCEEETQEPMQKKARKTVTVTEEDATRTLSPISMLSRSSSSSSSSSSSFSSSYTSCSPPLFVSSAEVVVVDLTYLSD